MNELEIITEDDCRIQLDLCKKINKVRIVVYDDIEYAATFINSSQAKQIVNFLNQVL